MRDLLLAGESLHKGEEERQRDDYAQAITIIFRSLRLIITRKKFIEKQGDTGGPED